MPGLNLTAPKGPKHTGFFRNGVNSRLDWYYNGTRVASASAALLAAVGAITATTSMAATTTVTGGTGLSATTGDINAVAGNVKLNSPGVFGSTQPVGAAVFMVGTAPAGTITTGGGIFTDGTTMKKIIAANTVSDIQT